MIKKNMGFIDRLMRLIVGIALTPIGLLGFEGLQGNFVGIIVALFSLMPLLTSLTGFCPGYVPFGISTQGKEPKSTQLSQ